MIVLIVGDFGVGKDTFADMLLSHFSQPAQKIKSYATRQRRSWNEDTHIFVSKKDWIEYINECPSDILAQTQIDDNFYGTFKHQFDRNCFNIYVVDDIGVRDVLNANIDDVYIIEIIRPIELIDVPEERIKRNRTDSYHYQADYRIINDGSKESLDDIAKDVALFLELNKPIK